MDNVEGISVLEGRYNISPGGINIGFMFIEYVDTFGKKGSVKLCVFIPYVSYYGTI